MKRGDIIIIAIVVITIIVGLAIIYLRPPGTEIVIEVDGEVVHTFPLSAPGRDELVDVHGEIGITTVHLGDGRVRVIKSECPDDICVADGWIDGPGRIIVCIPNRVIVSISGTAEDGDFDLR